MGFSLLPQSTKGKLQLANFMYRTLRLAGFSQHRIIRRHNVRFAADLAEGIDLSLFLFSGFQQHVYRNRLFTLPPDAVVFDVSANSGSISLILASLLPQSRIYAFEPTDYAFQKFQKNLDLNPELKARVEAIQTFVSDTESAESQYVAYASWRLDELGGTRHDIHCGIPKDAVRAQITLDSFVRRRGITRLDYIKIDTDGYELEVLRGAREILTTLRPIVVFEQAQYLLAERGQTFGDFEALFGEAGYKLYDSATGRPVTSANVAAITPAGGSIDVAAVPLR